MTSIKGKVLNFSRYDSLNGIVIAETKCGAIIETNEFVGYAFCSLRKGDRCICSIKKIDTIKNRILLSIDGVLYDAA